LVIVVIHAQDNGRSSSLRRVKLFHIIVIGVLYRNVKLERRTWNSFSSIWYAHPVNRNV